MWRDDRKQRLARYEKILLQSRKLYVPYEEDDSVTSDSDRVQEDVSHYVLAPAMNGFVQWLLHEAIKDGKRRLYFLARDGYLMYMIAKKYCAMWKLPVECRYLYCSRYSVRIPAFHLDMEEALNYICRGGIDVTMRKIMHRAGLDDKQALDIIADMHRNPDAVVPYAELKSIRAELRERERFVDLIQQKSSEEFPGLKGYLEQEGLLDDIPSAIVDSGWVGSMQKVLNFVLNYIREGSGNLIGYYWGLYELPKNVKADDYRTYYFAPYTNISEKIRFNNCLFEGVFSAPHGMTLYYACTEGIYQPVQYHVTGEYAAFMKKLERRICAYTDLLISVLYESDDTGISCTDADKTAVGNLLRLFMTIPNRMEAEVFGSMKFSDDVLEEDAQEIAVLMTDEELKSNFAINKALVMSGRKSGSVKESAWYEGSAVRNGHHVKRNLRQYTLVKRLRFERKQRGNK